MINLLPENEKQTLGREYKYRHAVVALSATLVLIVVALVVMMPAFVLALYKSSAVSTEAVVVDPAIAQTQAEFKKQLDDAKLLINVLRPQGTSTVPSKIIVLLAKHKTSENTITSIAYDAKETGTVVDVKGIAKSRESLSAFSDALRKEQGIADVNVPVSNFAKDVNIPYSFTVTTN